MTPNRTRLFCSRSTCEQVIGKEDLHGKVIGITGTTTGIGTATARSLALAGAHVIQINRNKELSEKQRDEIRFQKPDALVDFVECDLSSLASVKTAAQVVKDKGWALNTLILNAGVIASPQKETTDGLEPTFGVNHVAHFYLVSLLIPVLRQNSPSRIVIVSSEGHGHSGLNASKSVEEKVAILMPSPTTTTNSFTLYCYSKLCNVLFAKRLHRIENGNGVDVYMLHPGSLINTGLSRGWGVWGKAFNAVFSPFTKSLSQGAATSVYCSIHPDCQGISGKYWDSCWDDEKGLKKVLANDQSLQDALWSATDHIIQQFEEAH